MSTGKREFTKFVDLRNKITLHHYPDLTKDRKFYITLAEERLDESEKDWQSFMLLGNEYRVKGFPEKSIEKYQYILNNFRKDCSTQDLAGVYFALGNAYFQTNDAINAMSSYATGIAIHKTYRDNYYGLALILLNNNMFEAAIGILKEGLTNTVRAYSWMEDPFTWTFSLYDALGFAYFSLGRFEEALAAATCALQFDPSNEALQQNYKKCLNAILK